MDYILAMTDAQLTAILVALLILLSLALRAAENALAARGYLRAAAALATLRGKIRIPARITAVASRAVLALRGKGPPGGPTAML